MIGVTFVGKHVRMGVLEAVRERLPRHLREAAEQIAGIRAMFSGLVKVKEGVMGPVGIVTAMYTQAQAGWIYFLNLVALLTVAVGFLNVLPFPPLDGSKLVILAGEGIVGRSLDKQVEYALHLAGLAILLGLVIFLTFLDVRHISGHG